MIHLHDQTQYVASAAAYVKAPATKLMVGTTEKLYMSKNKNKKKKKKKMTTQECRKQKIWKLEKE
jgi:hypothetical protein